MKSFIYVSLLIPSLAMAQWSNSSAAPTVLVAQPGEQVQPKIEARADGGAYISYFSTQTSGYDVRLQSVDEMGNLPWGGDGIMIADRSYTSTVDYDLGLAANGDALVTFRDDRGGAGTNITVQRVDASGNLLWGTGVHATTATGSYNNPKVVALPNGDIVVGWIGATGGWSMRRLDANGNLLGSQVDVLETGHSLSICDLVAGANDQVIALWTRSFTTSFLSSKWLYAQKYDAAGTPLWNSGNPVQMYAPTGSPYGTQGGSVQNGYFPLMTSDEEGGFVCGWYENAGNRYAYVQHIDAQGNATMPANGAALTGPVAGQIWVSCDLAYDRWTDNYYAAAVQTDSATQSSYKVIAQKLNDKGQRQWSDSAVVVKPVNGFQKSFVQIGLAGTGASIVGFDATSATTGSVFAVGVNPDGTERFGTTTPFLLSSTNTSKARLWKSLSPTGDLLAAWTDGATGTGDLNGARLGEDGSLGNRATLVSGLVVDTSYIGPFGRIAWIVELSSGSGSETHRVMADVEGTIRFRTNLSGSVNVRIKGSHWLAMDLGTQSISGSTFELSTVATMVNGDVDGDNEVAPGDFSALSTAFGTVPGDTNWNRQADLDGDLEVGPSDYSILASSFGQIGD